MWTSHNTCTHIVMRSAGLLAHILFQLWMKLVKHDVYCSGVQMAFCSPISSSGFNGLTMAVLVGARDGYLFQARAKDGP